MLDRDRLATLREHEESRFTDLHPRSAALAERARGSLLAGVPMPWMTRWPGRFPVFVDRASGAHLTDVDGHEYVDLCLSDTGAMTEHALPQVTEAISARAAAGITTMLPSADAVWVGEELARRFVLRFARHLTGRPRVAVMDWCYHGTVDETLAVLDGDRVVARPGALAPRSTSR